MKHILILLIASTLAACSSDSKNEAAAPAPDTLNKATVNFSGANDDLVKYGPGGTVNSQVSCIQYPGINQSEISLVTAFAGKDVNEPSNWLSRFTVYFRAGEIPTGSYKISSDATNASVEYKVKTNDTTSAYFIPSNSCSFNVDKNGNNLIVNFLCSKMVAEKNAPMKISGSVDCIITQM